jgi:hypothetical protein
MLRTASESAEREETMERKFIFEARYRWYYGAATGAPRRTTRQTLRRTIRMRKGIAILLLGIVAIMAPRAGSGLAAQTEKKDVMPDPAVKVGDMAPDFTLMDTHRNQVSLHDFRGKKNVALAFYIFAFTGG